MTDLSSLSTRELAEALAGRPDLNNLVRPDGLVDPTIWPLRTALGAIPCVDSVAVRKNESGIFEGAIIRRRTGKFSGKLAIVGGVVGKFESIEDAIKRHWEQDLGLSVKLVYSWDHPVCERQYAPQFHGKNLPHFCEDPGKHSIASTHVVGIVGDTKWKVGEKIGGIEAFGLVWHSLIDCPPDDHWAYNMRETFLEVLARAHRDFAR